MIHRAWAVLAPWVRRFVLVSILSLQIVSLSTPPIHAVGVQVANRTSLGMSALWSLDDPFGTVVVVTGLIGSEQLPPGRGRETPATILMSVSQSLCDPARDVSVFRSWFGDAPGSVTVGLRLEQALVAGTVRLEGSFAEFPGCASPDFGSGSSGSLPTVDASATVEATATGGIEAEHHIARGFEGKIKTWSGDTLLARPAKATSTVTIAQLGISFSDLATEEALIFSLRDFEHAIGVCFAEPEIPWPHCPRLEG